MWTKDRHAHAQLLYALCVFVALHVCLAELLSPACTISLMHHNIAMMGATILICLGGQAGEIWLRMQLFTLALCHRQDESHRVVSISSKGQSP